MAIVDDLLTAELDVTLRNVEIQANGEILSTQFSAIFINFPPIFQNRCFSLFYKLTRHFSHRDQLFPPELPTTTQIDLVW